MECITGRVGNAARGVAYWEARASPALEGVSMKKLFIVFAVAAISVFLGAPVATGVPQTAGSSGSSANSSRISRLNPVHLLKKSSKSSTDQLAANSDESKKLTTQMRAQGLLPKGTDIKDACSNFKYLDDCVAALHAGGNLKLSFNCLKWEMTGVETRHPSTCKGPVGEQGMSLRNAIHLLKPGANAKAEAKHAEKQAQDDLKDATA